MDKVTGIQTQILLALARYKFLTVKQFQMLGISDATYTRKLLKTMVDRGKPFVKYVAFGVHPKVGKLENIYFLTHFGRDELVKGLGMASESIRLPKGTSTMFFQDYNHRRNFIFSQIAFYVWAEKEGFSVVVFESYFDQAGNNRKDGNAEAVTKIDIGGGEYFMPDGVLVLNRGGEKYLYLLEMYNGKDTKRVLQQMEKHAKCLALGTANEKYQVKRGCRVVAIFEFERSMQAVIERLSKDERFSMITDFFFFKSLDEVVQGDIRENWNNLKGETIRLL